MSRVSEVDEESFFSRYEAGDKIARDEMILALKPMVDRIVEKRLMVDGIFDKNMIENVREDLQQAGMLGVTRAFDKCDRRKGRFLTYAYYYARKEIYDFINAEKGYLSRKRDCEEPSITILIPEQNLFLKQFMDKLGGKLTQRGLDVCNLLLQDEAMNNEEIGQKLGISRERVRQIRKSIQSSGLRSILLDIAS